MLNQAPACRISRGLCSLGQEAGFKGKPIALARGRSTPVDGSGSLMVCAGITARMSKTLPITVSKSGLNQVQGPSFRSLLQLYKQVKNLGDICVAHTCVHSRLKVGRCRLCNRCDCAEVFHHLNKVTDVLFCIPD